MIKFFFTGIKYAILVALMLTSARRLEAQVTVSGPQCIIAGITYQYNIGYTGAQARSTKICVIGGVLSDSSYCSTDSIPPTTVFVIWKDSSFHQLRVVSEQESATHIVYQTHELSGGILENSSKVQLCDSNKTEYVFHCSLATGGSCSAQYGYQWQRSDDGLKWTDLGNATKKNLVFSDRVVAAVYFRRVTTETSSNTVEYSDTGVILMNGE